MKRIAVIGIGKLGLCFALQLEKAGCRVLGIDVDPDYIKAIIEKTLQSPEPGVEAALQAAVNLEATNDLKALVNFQPELIFIAVATPSIETGSYDHRFVDKVLQDLYTIDIPGSRKDVIIMCTVLPGYCDSKAVEALNHNYFLSYKPEFIAQGSIMQNLHCPDQMLIGEADELAGNKLEMLYSGICVSRPAVCRMSRLSAEITKLATNCFLTMKIAFANSIGDLCEKTGADTEKVLQTIGADSRIGTRFLKYGFGYGGPCFPRDNRALNYFARVNGELLPLSEATDKTNQHHLDFQFERYVQLHPDGTPIQFHSVTYKPGTSIIEESQQLALAVKLAKAGKKVIIHDKEEVIKQVSELMGDLFEYRIV